MDGATTRTHPPGQSFVGSWLTSIRVGEQPSVLSRGSINPLSADALLAFLADGTLIASASPAYPVPNEAIRGDRLLVGTGCGSWAATGDRAVSARCAALLRVESGIAVATVFVDATLELDADADTFSGRYTVDSQLSRGWTRNLPHLDGSVQGWRVGVPTGAGALAAGNT